MSEAKPDNWIGWLRSWVLIALGVLLAAWTSEGIRFETDLSLILGVLLISVLNVFLRPLLLLLTLPFVILTLGLGVVVINALLFWLAGSLVPGFEVVSFWAALWGALVVSFTSFMANVLFGSSRVRVRVQQNGGRPVKKKTRNDDVIDV
ncbi:phage holin family protein [Cerasicoccus arenae]|uniref:Phage holin family protein n=1 Tax=Cerasicoccus arenae TaxID=424488 RepID=A0A8J3D6L8_9BACT|nr:phage holin family protein [Cerasicoccus arenae]MBK1856999.1 phage holin family protein [Cerasicoccus arenae]GHB90311.1 hypothetical protein GCM10007047_01240 [Cerasicoccus arenae]